MARKKHVEKVVEEKSEEESEEEESEKEESEKKPQTFLKWAGHSALNVGIILLSANLIKKCINSAVVIAKLTADFQILLTWDDEGDDGVTSNMFGLV